MQRHLFIIDPVETLNLELDTSMKLAYQLTEVGSDVYVTEPQHLSWSSEADCAHAHVKQICFQGASNRIGKLSSTLRVQLSEFDGIHMRKDPPFDMTYVGTTWLLDAAARQTNVLNHPQALRDHNEKLAIFQFPQDTLAALVSSDTEEILDFVNGTAKGDAIFKPLDLFGGQGVVRVQHAQDGFTNSLVQAIEKHTNHGRALRLVQPFDRRIYDGEVRAFCVAGKPLAWCLKRPQAGSFLANTGAGASLEVYEPDSDEFARVERVAKHLHNHGVFVVGFDLIGGLISEINVTSPRLLAAPDDGTNYFEAFAEEVLRHCKR